MVRVAADGTHASVGAVRDDGCSGLVMSNRSERLELNGGCLLPKFGPRMLEQKLQKSKTSTAFSATIHQLLATNYRLECFTLRELSNDAPSVPI